MVDKTSEFGKIKNNEGLTTEQVDVFLNWKILLQKALTVEVENGYSNLKGRKEYFCEFISRELISSPKFFIFSHTERLNKFGNNFLDYHLLDESSRKRVVIDLRQFLHGLSRYYDNNKLSSVPKLRVRNTYSMIEDLNQKNKYNLNSPVCDLPGIGKKIEDKLFSMGIYLIRDFINYYPRDYVDYSSLLNIQNLVEGETATIVGIVRKINSFVSPRNSNLSILDLQIQDSTGRIKATRFYIGRRFSNRAYLKSQEHLYPVGCTVAVSGLIRKGDYSKCINDPIIEVLESSRSQLKSRKIGQIIPIYSLVDGMSADSFRRYIELVLPLTISLSDPIPDEIIRSLSLPKKGLALMHIHFPPNKEALRLARRRLVFDEFFGFQLIREIFNPKSKKNHLPSNFF